MDNNTTETTKQVFCTPEKDHALCVDGFGTVVSGLPDASVQVDDQSDAGTLNDFLESEQEESSSEPEVTQLQSADTAIMFSLGVLALLVVSVLVKKYFK